MERLTVGLLGLGTVGSGVARILTREEGVFAGRRGPRIALKVASVRDLGKARPDFPSSLTLTDDPRRVVDDPEVDVIVEAMGGTDPALSLVLRALANGKDVVTANKAMLADHGPEVFAAARAAGRAVAFEASVGGGIPIIQALGVGLAANRITALAAIVNGTCNFILSKMIREGLAYETALAEAQVQGFAEADPAMDVDGTDTAHKLAVLAQIAFGAGVTTDQILREGIDKLQADDIRYAGELGYTVKLLAHGKLWESGLELRVAPTLVKKGTPLAEVSGPYNAIRVIGDSVGDTLFCGRGAGMMPTASAIVGDLIDVATGRAALTFRALDLWPADAPATKLVGPEQIRSKYYLRFSIADRPGVIAALTRVLGDHGISIASVIQHDPGEDVPPSGAVPLVVMTHMAVRASVEDALAEIDRLDVVHSPSVCLGVED
ncbi:homoserine dehydrogenase [Isosphaeraceae bacterium EP7]